MLRWARYTLRSYVLWQACCPECMLRQARCPKRSKCVLRWARCPLRSYVLWQACCPECMLRRARCPKRSKLCCGGLATHCEVTRLLYCGGVRGKCLLCYGGLLPNERLSVRCAVAACCPIATLRVCRVRVVGSDTAILWRSCFSRLRGGRRQQLTDNCSLRRCERAV